MGCHRLDRNERNFPFSDSFRKSLNGIFSDDLLQVYPETDSLTEAVAQYVGVASDKIFLNSGSDQVIKTIFETYISPGERVLLHKPGFALYDVYPKFQQAETESVYCASDLSFDWNQFVEKITPSIRMVVLENPNGFLGTVIPDDVLRRILKKTHELGIVLVLDEAYYHFYCTPSVDWLAQYDNLIIVRTFSKALGLAGLRCGYAISRPENINNLRRLGPVFPVSSAAIGIVQLLLKFPDELESYLKANLKSLAHYKQKAREAGLGISESRANFVAFRFSNPEIVEKLRVKLQDRKILIRRPFREEHLKTWVRVATAPLPIQELFFELLGQL